MNSKPLNTALFNLALECHQAGKLAEAESLYRQILQKEPNSAEVHNQLGIALRDQKQFNAAVESFQQALSINPDLVEAHYKLGTVFGLQDQYDAAINAYQRALLLEPDHADAHYNMANLLMMQGKLSAAVLSYQQAVLIKPDFAYAYCNLGNALADLGQLSPAIASYQQALSYLPEDSELHFNLASAYLLMTNFEQGFQEYVWRESLEDVKKLLPLASRSLIHRTDRMLPFSSQGLKITLLREQGLGDELFFIRFAKELKKRGADWITYLGDTRITAMLGRANCVDEIIGQDSVIDEDQSVFSIGDLPLLLGVASAADIPPPVFIPVLAEKQAMISARLAPYCSLPRPFIGVTWRAGTKNKKGSLFKELPLTQLATALQEIQATFVILQRNPEQGEIASFEQALGRPVVDCCDLNDDLEGMLALLAELDDYIGVSNTNMHLRASVGKTAHVLVSVPQADFRWMAEGKSSPWFPGFIVYRAYTDQNWDAVFTELKKQFMSQ